jgi:hypothetical protein
LSLWPAFLFEAANIMARITGYVAKRYVDIGDHVEAGQLLAEISAPELDHQIAQAQATLALSEAALNQAKAKRGHSRAERRTGKLSDLVDTSVPPNPWDHLVLLAVRGALPQHAQAVRQLGFQLVPALADSCSDAASTLAFRSCNLANRHRFQGHGRFLLVGFSAANELSMLPPKPFGQNQGRSPPFNTRKPVQRSFCIVLPFHVCASPDILIVDDNLNQEVVRRSVRMIMLYSSSGVFALVTAR